MRTGVGFAGKVAMMRVVVLGARGQLGRDLARTCPPCHEYMGWDLPQLDIRDYRTLNRELFAFKPNLIVNAAAYTDVERAEDEPEAAYAGNEYGARNVAAAAQSLGATVVYYSTDYIFDGSASLPYTEEDAPNPINVYGKSKLAGESATKTVTPHHFILRTAWLFGPGGNNFIEKMLRLAGTHDRLRVVQDEVGSPTHSWDLAQATWNICETGAYGVYNVVNTGACSRFELAKTAFELAGIPMVIEPCSAAEYPSKARRPAFAPLATDKVIALCGNPPRSWRDALAHYLERR